MINLYTTGQFERNFKRFLKKHPDLETLIEERLDLFIQNPQTATLNTHKLTGNLSEQWAFSINYSYRITFIWQGDNVYLTNIGAHDQVY